MNNNFFVVKVLSRFGTSYQILNSHDFLTSKQNSEVLFEAESFSEASDWLDDYKYIFGKDLI